MGADFISGIIVGLGASIPLGPVAVLCIQRTLSKGHTSGLMTGFGAATCDTFFAAISLLGISFIEDFIKNQQYEVMFIGGIIVAVFGIFVFRTNPVKQIKKVRAGYDRRKKRYWADYFSANLMTVTNPGAFLFMLGMMTFVGVESSSPELSSVIILGVLFGTSSWWLFLTAIINKCRNWFRLRQLLILNRISGIAIMIFGIAASIQGAIHL